MATLLSTSGNNTTLGFRQRPSTVVLPIANGNGVIGISVDANQATAPATYGDRTGVVKFEIWYSPDRVTWTQVATVTPSVPMDDLYKYSADLFVDNSIALVWVGTTGIRYRKITFGTWAIGAEIAVAPFPTNGGASVIDVSVSESETVLLATYTGYTAGATRVAYRVYGLRAGQTVFEQVGTERFLSATNGRTFSMAIGISWCKGLLPGGKRAYCVIIGYATVNADQGFSAWMDSTAENVPLTSAGPFRVVNAQGAGEVSPVGTYNTQIRACGACATDDDNTIIMGMYSIVPDSHCRVAKVHYNGSTWVSDVPPDHGIGTSNTFNTTPSISMAAITFAKDSVSFHVNLPAIPNNTFCIPYVYSCYIDPVTNVTYWKGGFRYNSDKSATQHVYTVYGGGGRNARKSTRHDMMFHRAAVSGGNTGSALNYLYTKTVRAPATVTPKSGSTSTSSTPPLALDADIDLAYPQTGYVGRWDFASNASFTTNLHSYTQSLLRLSTIEGTDKTGVVVRLTGTLPNSIDLSQGTWFVRGALVDMFGNVGTFLTNPTAISITHPPSATQITPSHDQLMQYGDGNIQFDWEFTDPADNDFQTAFQVFVQNNDTKASVYDSGKISSGTTAHLGPIPITSKDANLRWAVRLWDRDDVAGAYSPYAVFVVADQPDVQMITPTSGATYVSGIPTVTFTPVVGGGRNIKSYRVTWSKDGATIYDSNPIKVDLASGTTITYTAKHTVFKNNTSYSARVYVTDELGLEGYSGRIPFQVVFTPPAGPSGVSVSTGSFNNEALGGYVQVSWSDLNRDPDFVSWAIYRQDDVIDPNTLAVVKMGEQKLIGYVYEPTATYLYRDYWAPSSHRVSYIITQQVSRFGDVIESANTVPTTVYPISDGYWLIEPSMPTVDAIAMRLSIVTADDYSEDYDEAEYTVIGRGRHVDRGDYLGVKGSLTAQIRDDSNQTARLKKQKLEDIKDKNLNLYLRNPYGDLFKVYVGNISVSRISGVGTSEFCDVTIPYTEVYV